MARSSSASNSLRSHTLTIEVAQLKKQLDDAIWNTQKLSDEKAILEALLDGASTHARKMIEEKTRLQKERDDAISRRESDKAVVRATMERNKALTDENTALRTTYKEVQRELMVVRVDRGNLKKKHERVVGELKMLQEAMNLTKEHSNCVDQVFAHHEAQEKLEKKQKQTIREDREKALKGNIAALEADLAETVLSLGTVMTENEKAATKADNLKKQLQFVKPLVELGRKPRRLFQENATFYSAENLENAAVQPVAKIFKDGNDTAWYGDILADAADITISKLDGEDTTQREKAFKTIYGVVLNHSYLHADSPPEIIQLFNMRGTMASCGSFTKHSNDSTIDEDFNEMVCRCFQLFGEFRDQKAESPLTPKPFGEWFEVSHAFVVMPGFVQKIVEKERERVRPE